MEGPVIAVDGSVALHGASLTECPTHRSGQLLISLHGIGRIGSTVLLRSQQGISLRGLIGIEGVRPSVR